MRPRSQDLPLVLAGHRRRQRDARDAHRVVSLARERRCALAGALRARAWICGRGRQARSSTATARRRFGSTWLLRERSRTPQLSFDAEATKCSNSRPRRQVLRALDGDADGRRTPSSSFFRTGSHRRREDGQRPAGTPRVVIVSFPQPSLLYAPLVDFLSEDLGRARRDPADRRSWRSPAGCASGWRARLPARSTSFASATRELANDT